MDTSFPLMQPPTSSDYLVRERCHSSYRSLKTFNLPKATQRKYTTQFADLYFARLALLKRHVESVAEAAWADFQLGSETVRKVERVLDVRQGELCWVVGTVFMDMPMKPNILDDLSKESWIIAPPPRDKYLHPDGNDQVMLEDESGRLQLTGRFLPQYSLCTGAIVAVLGTENRDGAFEVIEVKLADLPPQPARWALSEGSSDEGKLNGNGVHNRPTRKIAIVSGLEIDGVSGDTLILDLLAEYLIGEAGDDQEVSRISRLILAGNSFADSSPIPTRQDSENIKRKSVRKFGIDPMAYNAAPSLQLDQFLSVILPSIPVTLMPGATDPASVSVPQQPLHAAYFPQGRQYIKAPTDNSPTPSWFDSVSNPWEGEVDGWRVLATGGQPVNDMFKYIDGDDRLGMMECFLRWRNVAPTAPDTLWTYPFQDRDPFVIKTCPHIFIVGDQPRLETTTINGPDGQSVRLLTIPSFRETGLLALLDSETLEVECIRLELFDKGNPSANGATIVEG